MKILIIGVFSMLSIFSMKMTYASDEAEENCAENQGSLLTGQVVQEPKYSSSSVKAHGVSLSHTHLKLKADDGRGVYDIVIDNPFATDYVVNSKDGPRSIMEIKVGDRLEICGHIHLAPDAWMRNVHSICGDLPSQDKPDGWLKRKNKDGTWSENLMAGTSVCPLFEQPGMAELARLDVVNWRNLDQVKVADKNMLPARGYVIPGDSTKKIEFIGIKNSKVQCEKKWTPIPGSIENVTC